MLKHPLCTFPTQVFVTSDFGLCGRMTIIVKHAFAESWVLWLQIFIPGYSSFCHLGFWFLWKDDNHRQAHLRIELGILASDFHLWMCIFHANNKSLSNNKTNSLM